MGENLACLYCEIFSMAYLLDKPFPCFFRLQMGGKERAFAQQGSLLDGEETLAVLVNHTTSARVEGVTQLTGLAPTEPWVQFPAKHKTFMVVHTCTQGAEAGGSVSSCSFLVT